MLPSGAVIRYTYRADGRLLTIRVNGVEIVRDIEYHSFGEPKSWNYGTSDRYERVFDQDGRIKEHTAGAVRRGLGFDAASRIRSIADSAGGPNQWAFDYDALDRLKTANNAGTHGAIAGLALGWAYDATGNRTAETRGATSIPNVIDPTSNKLNQVNGVARQYDAAGNTRSDGAGLASVYNARNRLVQTTKAGLTALYAHNAFGERVCKSTSGVTCAQGSDRTEYFYDDDGHLIGEYGPMLAEHTEILWLDDTPIAVLKRRPGSSDGGPTGAGAPTPWSGMAAGGTDVYFVHPDHLDTPRVVVNALNQPVWHWDSAPFGDTAANEQPTVGLPSFTLNLRFPGQQYDRETGTHYNYFRDYEAQTGRYLQSDPIGLAGAINGFEYAFGNPTGLFDSLGLKARGCSACGISRHGSQPRPRPRGMQSHHIIQNQWVQSNGVEGYDYHDAPAILLDTSSHSSITNRQNTRRDERVAMGNPRWGGTLRDEFHNSSSDLRNAGVSDKCRKRAIKKSYKYFDALGAFL